MGVFEKYHFMLLKGNLQKGEYLLILIHVNMIRHISKIHNQLEENPPKLL